MYFRYHIDFHLKLDYRIVNKTGSPVPLLSKKRSPDDRLTVFDSLAEEVCFLWAIQHY